MGGKGSIDDKEYAEYPYKQITSDDLNKHGFKWFMRDNLPDNLPDGIYVYNLDKSTGEGTHWTAFALKYPDIYYIDPFGSHLKGHNGIATPELKQWAKRNGYKNIYGNEYQFQNKWSWLCGHYAMYFATKLKKHWSMLNPNTFDNIVRAGLDKYPTDKNIKIITKWAMGKGFI